MIRKDMKGVEISRKSVDTYRPSDQFQAADVFMAVGMKDPVLGAPAMRKLAKMWKNGCYYVEIEEAGHFVQELGGKVARLAIELFKKRGKVEGVRRIEPRKSSL